MSVLKINKETLSEFVKGEKMRPKTKLYIGDVQIGTDHELYEQAVKIFYGYIADSGKFDVEYIKTGLNEFTLIHILPQFKDKKLREMYKAFLPSYIKRLQLYLEELNNG